jgi:hypothetical protein
MNSFENDIMIEMIQKMLVEMSCGNSGAISVINELLKNYTDDFFEIIEKMKKHNIIDYHIWVLYKEHNKKINEFVNHIKKLE